MKKISILSLHLGYGGIERSVVSLANLLADTYQVEIACVYRLYDNPIFPLNSKVEVRYLTDVKPNRDEFMDSLRKKKFICCLKEGVRGLKILRMRKKSMVDYIRKSDCDIIIATRDIFDYWLGKYGQCNIQKIGWEHNHYHDDLKYARKIVRSNYQLDYLVLVSKELQKFYSEKLKNSHCECVYIPNVISDIPEKCSSFRDKRLVSIGRLSKEKGYLDLLQIFKKIVKSYPDWKLDIIGDGEEKETLVEYINQNHLDKNVLLHGFQKREYIDKVLQHSSIYVMSSYTESFGIVLLEAMSHGLPCVAFSSAEGAKEIIEDGKTGYLIENRKFSQYIEKVEYLIKNKEIAKKMGRSGREKVKDYTGEKVILKWLDIFEKR